MFLLAQGSGAVRELPTPEELLFTLDEKVRGDISLAKQRYLEAVSRDQTCQCENKQQRVVHNPSSSCPGSPDSGPAARVLRLHRVRESNHQTDQAASGHFCSAGVAVGLLQTQQEVSTARLISPGLTAGILGN